MSLNGEINKGIVRRVCFKRAKIRIYGDLKKRKSRQQTFGYQFLPNPIKAKNGRIMCPNRIMSLLRTQDDIERKIRR